MQRVKNKKRSTNTCIIIYLQQGRDSLQKGLSCNFVLLIGAVWIGYCTYGLFYPLTNRRRRFGGQASVANNERRAMRSTVHLHWSVHWLTNLQATYGDYVACFVLLRIQPLTSVFVLDRSFLSFGVQSSLHIYGRRNSRHCVPMEHWRGNWLQIKECLWNSYLFCLRISLRTLM